MIVVYSGQYLALVTNMKNVLEMYKIESNITGEYLAAAVGEIPPIEAWPKLWVTEQDYMRAKKIIDEALADPIDSPEVLICPKCSEEIESQFTKCWNCGASVA